MKKASKYSVAYRLSLVQAVVVLIVMGFFSISLSALITRRIEQRAEKDLTQQVTLLVSSMSIYHTSLADSVTRLAYVYKSMFPGPFFVDSSRTILVGDKPTPVLKSGGMVVNQQTEIPDKFLAATKAQCSIMIKSGGNFIRIATTTKDANGNRNVGVLLDREHPAYAALAKGEDFVGKAKLFGKDYMTCYIPIKDKQGEVIAAAGVALDFTESLKAMKEKILAVKIGQTGYIYALNAKEGNDFGMTMMHPTNEGKNNINSKDANGKAFVREIVTRKDGAIRYFWLNKEMKDAFQREKLAAFRHMKEWDWVVVASTYMDELNTDAIFLRNTMFSATIFVVILLVLLFVLMVRRWVSRPLRDALVMTSHLASGDFTNISSTAPDFPKTADEVEQLSHGIQHMASSLRKLLEQVNDSSMDVSAAAVQVKANSMQIAKGADAVVSQSSSVATAGEEMSATTVDIARNCQLAADGAQCASKTAGSGVAVVKKTMEAMEQIAERVKESAKTVENLGVRSVQIGTIIGTIEDIADQTNLLALNAAIEAARAGEQGRGFAVVADEVRALAERTTCATREIGEMIKTVQNETKGAVSIMEQGVFQVESGTMEASLSGEALQDILQQINDVAVQVAQIATAAEEQSATVGDISNNMQQITEVVQQTSKSAHESASAAAQLSGNAEELQRVVRQFKL